VNASDKRDSDKRYTDSLPRFLGWTLWRALLRCGASCSGLCGSLLPPTAALRAVDEGFPPVTWWRTGARTGAAAAEAFANSATRPPREPGAAQAREQPSADEVS
jgi:hypothetical protein